MSEILLLTNIFSSDLFASQQFRKTGINRFRNGGNVSCKEKIINSDFHLLKR